MIFLDTGYFVAIVKSRDALRPRALAWTNYLAEPLLTTEYVLLETVNLLSAPADRAKGHALLADVAADPAFHVVRMSAELLDEGLRMHREHDDKAWSLTDCISFVVMRKRGVHRAMAHDHHFMQAGFDALLRRDPE